MRRFAEAAKDTGTDKELSEKEAKAAVNVSSLVPETATADLLRSPSERLQLY